jgi:DNA mismatch repair ATPase MutL
MLKSSSEEYTKMVDIVMKMALRNTHVAFTLKRDAQVEPDVHTNGKETTTILHNMKMLYGIDMIKDIYETTIEFADTPYKFQCKAHFTGTQYSVSFLFGIKYNTKALISLFLVFIKNFIEFNNIYSFY